LESYRWNENIDEKLTRTWCIDGLIFLKIFVSLEKGFFTRDKFLPRFFCNVIHVCVYYVPWSHSRHIDNATNTITTLSDSEKKKKKLREGNHPSKKKTYVHIIETLVDIIQFSVMSDIFVNLNFSIKVIFGKKEKKSTSYFFFSPNLIWDNYLGQVLGFRSCL